MDNRLGEPDPEASGLDAATAARVFQDAGVAFAVSSRDGSLILANRAFEALTGYSAEDLRSTPDWMHQLAAPDYLNHEREQIYRAIETRQPQRYETEYVRKDGSRIAVEVYFHVIFAPDGTPESGYAFVLDISERRRLEAEREYVASFPNMNPNPVFEIGADAVIKYANDAAVRLMPDLSVEGLHHPLIAQTAEEYAHLPVGSSETFEIEIRDETYALTVLRTDSGFRFYATNIDGLIEAEHVGSTLLRGVGSLFQDLDVDAVAETLASITVELTGKERVVVSLFEDAETLKVVATRSASSEKGSTISLSSLPRVFAAIANQCRTTVIDYSTSDVGEQEREQAAAFRSALALVVPIVHDEECLGLIALDTPSDRTGFSERQIAVVETLALQAGAALHNARIYGAQHEIAEVLQEALLALPESVDGIEFASLYRAASDKSRVGGDFVDVFELPAERIGLVVGDVSGKGLQAAALTSTVRAVIRAQLLEGLSPAEAVTKTNGMLHHFTETDSFVTLFVGLLHAPTGRLLYANGGHPAPVACSANGGIRTLDGAGPIVGAFPGVDYDDRVFVVPRDFTVVCVSDGVIESRQDSRLFGNSRLESSLSTLSETSPTAVVQHVLDEVSGFTHGRLTDDLTILAFRRTSGT